MTFPIIPASTINGSYQISRSLRFRSSASAYLSRTTGTSTDVKKVTISMWVKPSLISTNASWLYTVQSPNVSGIFIDNTNAGAYGAYKLIIRYSIASGATVYYCVSNLVMRDPSAWYHLVVVQDTAASTGNRIKAYLNGVAVTFGTYNEPALNETSGGFNPSSVGVNIGSYDRTSSGYFFDGYLAEVNFIDGQALTPSSFGAYDVNGVWQPAKYTGSYGTNGFYLNFSDNSGATATTIGKDSSGNSNNWTPNNISVTSGTTYDSMIDSPTNYADGGNGRGNYAVLNPLIKTDSGSANTMSEGNLRVNCTSNSYGDTSFSSIFVSSGKWYAEFTLSNSSYPSIEIFNMNYPPNFGSSGNGRACLSPYGYGYLYNGNKQNNSSPSAYGSALAVGDVIGVALDMDNGKVWFSKNGTWQASGDPAAGTNAAFTSLSGNFAIGICDSQTVSYSRANFGQRPFTYTPPSGFSALNTQNLPTPTIAAGNKYFDATTYGGTGSTNPITNSGSFQPDLVWIRNRGAASGGMLLDAVRGSSVFLQTTNTNGDATNSGDFVSFNPTGFSVGGNGNLANASSNTYVGWQWNAGGSTISNTAGSITSQVRANPTAGFSVVTFTSGSPGTVGHGLGVAPSMIILKSRNNASGWSVYHSSIGNTGSLNLQTTAATNTSVDWWSNTSPTSSVFSIGANIINGWTWVGYCFAPVAGYSAFGSYTGNGSTDGVFVYTGFRPKFIMFKNTGAVANWLMLDAARNTYNAVDLHLHPNLSNAETNGSPPWADFLSNGFKLRNTYAETNASSNSYIYAAFAENPFRTARAR